MLKITIQFPSVTYAQKAARLLEKEGTRTRLSKRSSAGCGYGLVVSYSDSEDVFALLKKAGIPYST